MEVQNNIKLTLKNFASLFAEKGERSQKIFEYFNSNILLLSNVVPFVGPSGFLVFLVETLKDSSNCDKPYFLGKIYIVLKVATNRYHFIHETNGLSQLLHYLKHPDLKEAVFVILKTFCLLKFSKQVKKLFPKVIFPFCLKMLKEYTHEKLSKMNESLLTKEQPTESPFVSKVLDKNATMNELKLEAEKSFADYKKFSKNSVIDSNITNSKIVLSVINNLATSIDFLPSSKFVRTVIYYYLFENSSDASYLIKKMVRDNSSPSNHEKIRLLGISSMLQSDSFSGSHFIQEALSSDHKILFESHVFNEFIMAMYLPLIGLFRKNIKFTISSLDDPTGMSEFFFNYTRMQKAETQLKEFLARNNTRLKCSLTLCYLQE